MRIDKRLGGEELPMRHEVQFEARGHSNVLGTHGTTLEITKEHHLMRTGTCIIATDSTLALGDLGQTIREIARESTTRIVLEMSVGSLTESVIGHGSLGLDYKSRTCMVARTSDYECDRTLMVNANKAARDLDRSFVNSLRDPAVRLKGKLIYISE
ncbi:DUF371 domain-containing protein [Candidatus Thorarchaeota archaeon]|nr:MAG: DUF371 domain-containing protein [Candidatus Thorarchaeota archaeon]